MSFMKRLISFFAIILIGAVSGHSEQNHKDWSHFHGVWANKDCELVRTAGYSLLFERDGSQLTAVLHKISEKESGIRLNPRAKAVFNNADETVTLKAKDLFENENAVIQNPPSNNLKLDVLSLSLEKRNGNILLMKNGRILEELDLDKKQLKIKRPDGEWVTLNKIEDIVMTEPYDMPVNVTRDNVGRRIQEWQLGTRYWKDPESVFWKLDIGTNRHLYTFTMNDNFLYCRAARIRSNNHGTVFSQNIRMVVRGENRDEGYIGYMAPDNLEKAGSELIIDNENFDRSCGIAYDIAIYWSLNSFRKGEILVNGCDQVYERRPSSKNDADMREWIAFKKY